MLIYQVYLEEVDTGVIIDSDVFRTEQEAKEFCYKVWDESNFFVPSSIKLVDMDLIYM